MQEVTDRKAVTRKEYCHTLEMIYDGAWDREDDQLKIADAYAKHCTF